MHHYLCLLGLLPIHAAVFAGVNGSTQVGDHHKDVTQEMCEVYVGPRHLNTDVYNVLNESTLLCVRYNYIMIKMDIKITEKNKTHLMVILT